MVTAGPWLPSRQHSLESCKEKASAPYFQIKLAIYAAHCINSPHLNVGLWTQAPIREINCFPEQALDVRDGTFGRVTGDVQESWRVSDIFGVDRIPQPTQTTSASPEDPGLFHIDKSAEERRTSLHQLSDSELSDILSNLDDALSKQLSRLGDLDSEDPDADFLEIEIEPLDREQDEDRTASQQPQQDQETKHLR